MHKSFPVYALVGPDPFLQLLKLAEILRDLPKDAQRVDADGERAELADVLDELRSFAMFGGGKVVVVRDADAFITRFREQLEDYVAAPSDSATLVLRLATLPKAQRIYKAIDKVGRIEDCSPPRDLAKWVMDRARAAHKVTMEADAARMLVDLVGDDLGRLDGEIGKLAIDADETGGKIGAQKVSQTVAFQREQEMWDLTNALAAGEVSEALRRWRQLIQLDPSAEFRAVTWLGMWLEDVGTVLASKRGAGPGVGKLTWKYKDRLQKFLRTAEHLGVTGHSRALDLLAEVDHQSKTGVGDAAGNVERFILEVGAGAMSRQS
jgi:DNA polymerase III delta subunit